MNLDFILQNLSQAERDEFLREILDAQIAGDDIQQIILCWEATAEINSLPQVKKKIIARSKKLKQFLLQAKDA